MKKANQILFLSAFLLTFMITKSINVMQDTKEIWKEISGYPSHMVSNIGRIKSVDHKVPHPTLKEYTVKGKVRKPLLNHSGYFRIQLAHRGEYMAVHRIVALAFIPNPNKLKEVNHINGVKSDNRVENLEWCSRSENHNHALRTGLLRPPRGSKHWNSKLDEMQVKVIRACASEGITGYKLARYFKVCDSMIYNIINLKSWCHLY